MVFPIFTDSIFLFTVRQIYCAKYLQVPRKIDLHEDISRGVPVRIHYSL